MIYVFASGNGLENGDNANYNGYANSIYCLTVGAMTDQGLRTSYATPGACLTVSAPSGDIGDPGIVTTDMVDSGGYNPNQTTADFADTDYTKYFAGTSASAPLVSGIVALMLQANPNLGWRDVKEILIRTATKNLPADPEWATNSAGFHFNHFFGAGLVNAQAAVSAALTWTNLAPATNQSVALNGVDLPIPDGSSSGVSLGFAFTNDALRVEHVRLIVDMVHLRRGDIAITLTSPTGMQSRLTELHGDINTNFYSWPLTSVRHWGESSVGTWTATFADLRAGQTGQLISARLELIGAPLNPLQVVDRAATEVDGKANGNGAIDPGETAELRVALQNTATYPFGALYGTLTTATPGVTLLSAGSSFPSLPATGTGTNSDAFVYRVARSVPCGTLIQFTLLSTNASGRWTNSFSQVVGQPADAASSTDTVDSADAPKAVPDLATTLSTNSISLPGDRFIDDVKVSLRLDHTAVGDLQIALVHPDGTEVVIADHEGFNSPDMGTGNCGAGEVRTVFDDQASTPVSSGAAPFAGSYRPDNPLSVFRGKRLNGNWRLRLSDQYSNDSGTLLCWGLQFVSHEQTVNCSVFNPPPVASDLTIATPYQTAVTAALTAGDVDGDPLSFGIVAAPAHGQLTNFNAASGAFTYTPDPDYAGADLFTFQASDGLTNSATAVVHVSVNPTAPLFTGFDHLSDSRFVLHVLAPPGPAYVIETSTNLVDWLPVATNSAPANPFDFVDADAPNYRARFYRVKQ
jgi:subtilisin-like proprotein convertase family protein